jgi:hypothetical protein
MRRRQVGFCYSSWIFFLSLKHWSPSLGHLCSLEPHFPKMSTGMYFFSSCEENVYTSTEYIQAKYVFRAKNVVAPSIHVLEDGL